MHACPNLVAAERDAKVARREVHQASRRAGGCPPDGGVRAPREGARAGDHQAVGTPQPGDAGLPSRLDWSLCRRLGWYFDGRFESHVDRLLDWPFKLVTDRPEAAPRQPHGLARQQ